MGKPKFVMPRASTLFRSRKKHWRKGEPTWVYLEREMKEKSDVKPYNEKVGEWLRYLRDLKAHFRNEDNRKYTRLKKEVGPPWFKEFSRPQKAILHSLDENLHKDILDGLPKKTNKALKELGMIRNFNKQMLMKTIKESSEDPIVFIWNLYKEIYKVPPNIIRPNYDHDAMMLMSSIVFLDEDACIKKMNELTRVPKPPPPRPKKKGPIHWKPKGLEFADYLQKTNAPMFSPHPSPKELASKQKKKAPQVGMKIKVKSDESYEKITKDTTFIDKRIASREKEKEVERVCDYPFWEPPVGLRAKTKKMRNYLLKLKMFKLKPQADYMKYKGPQDNLQFHIGTVAYVQGKPRYLIEGVCIIPTEFIPWHGGIIILPNGERVTHILGYCKYPRDVEDKCDEKCDCLKKWNDPVMKYLNDSKCRCGHLYDFGHEEENMENCPESPEIVFHPPTRHSPYYFDYPRIFNSDKWEYFIRDAVAAAVRSRDPTPVSTGRTVDAKELKDSELVQALFSEMTDEPLALIRLPQANQLNSLKEWARKRFKGEMSPKQHKQLKLKSQRRWVELENVEFIDRAHFIPFTKKQRRHMNMDHIGTIRNLAEELRKDHKRRNAMKLLEHTRLFWPTMKADVYKNKIFHDIFFTYMPNRLKDVYILRPYHREMAVGIGGKTCPIDR